jgi:hypothetical protein
VKRRVCGEGVSHSFSSILSRLQSPFSFHLPSFLPC